MSTCDRDGWRYVDVLVQFEAEQRDCHCAECDEPEPAIEPVPFDCCW